MGLLKSKIFERRSHNDLQEDLNKFLENITSDQIVRLEYVCGGAGQSSSYYYSILLIYNDKIENDEGRSV